jgi:pilus assembly protein CpaC
MIRKLFRLSACALLASSAVLPELAMAQSAAETGAPVLRIAANSRTAQRITLGLNKAEVIELDNEVKDVDVAGPEIVDAVVKSPRRILLIAQKVGQTNIIFSDANGRRVLSLDVRVEKDTADLATLMRQTMPNTDIRVTAIADNIVLAGNVASALEAKRAADLAVGFTGDPKKVVNMLSVSGGQQVVLKVRVAEMSRSIAKQFGINSFGALNVAGVPILTGTTNPYGLLGHALSDVSGGQIGSICPDAFLPHVTGTSTAATTTGNSTVNTITNGINNSSTAYNTNITSTNPQLQQPGIVTGTQNTDTSTLVGSAVQTITSALAPTLTSSTTTTVPCASANNAQGVLNGLEQVGLVHMLAEPNLVSVNGETAKFLSGGEFPVPTAKDNQGNVTLEFKQFGVGLSFTPVVMSPDHISIQISTEVSELSTTGAFQLQGGTQIINGVSTTVPGLTIPALHVNRAETTVEMPSGGTFAIAGLMQHVSKQTIDGFPGLKDMPVLGALFRSRDYQNDETELVVLASVYLVQPNAAAAFAAPTDGFVPPSDPETLLLGRLNATYKKDEPAGKPPADVGFIVQ